MAKPSEKKKYTCDRGVFEQAEMMPYPYCKGCKHLKEEIKCKFFETKER